MGRAISDGKSPGDENVAGAENMTARATRAVINPDRHIVLIYSADGTHLVTKVMAVPNLRLRPTGKTVFQFWETPAGQPKALRAWFYPGDNFGQEFVYVELCTGAERRRAT